MKKDRIMRTIIAVQAVCMLALIFTVLTRPSGTGGPPDQAPPAQRDPAGTGSEPPAGSGEAAAARVGRETIAESEYLAELRRQYGSQVLRTLLLRKAVRLEADSHGIRITAEEMNAELDRLMEGYEDESGFYEAMERQLGLSKQDVREDTEYRLLLEKIALRGVTVTDREVEAYIADHPEEFRPLTELRLSWILTETREQAEKVLELAEAGENFAALARTYSIDEFSAESGGDLGFADEEDPFLNQAMLKAARSMNVGELGGPVAADGGWAVFRLMERKSTLATQGEERREAVRRQLALAAAPPLDRMEEALLAKYEAKVFAKPENAAFAP